MQINFGWKLKLRLNFGFKPSFSIWWSGGGGVTGELLSGGRGAFVHDLKTLPISFAVD